jgi:recombination protein RecA
MPELQLAVDAIQRRFGEQAMLRASRLAAVEPWPSGLAPVDRLTGIGGLPRARLTVLSGHGTCGKLSLALDLLARGSRELSQVVLVDPSRSFDPGTLVASGGDLDRVLAIRPRDGAGCGEAALSLARAGCRLLVVLLPARVLASAEAWLPALEGAASRSGTVVIAVAEDVPPALAHSSSFTVGLERIEWLVAAGEPVGARTRLRCLKNRVGVPGREAEIELRYPIASRLAGETTFAEPAMPHFAGEMVDSECQARSAAV